MSTQGGPFFGSAEIEAARWASSYAAMGDHWSPLGAAEAGLAAALAAKDPEAMVEAVARGLAQHEGWRDDDRDEIALQRGHARAALKALGLPYEATP